VNDGQQPSRADDEIDLRDLALALIEGWRWILGTTVAVIALAALYLFMATPIFSTNIVFAPSSDGLQTLNSMPGISYSRGEVVGEFSLQLSAYENFSHFLEASEDHRNRLVDSLQAVEDEAQLPAIQYRLFTENLAVENMGDEEDPDPRRKLSCLSPSALTAPTLPTSTSGGPGMPIPAPWWKGQSARLTRESAAISPEWKPFWKPRKNRWKPALPVCRKRMPSS